jgi:hypothetical protein
MKSRSRNDLLTEAVAILDERGFAADVDFGAKHLKIFWTANGRRRLVILSKSPGARRVNPASLARLKRMLGLGEGPQP